MNKADHFIFRLLLLLLLLLELCVDGRSNHTAAISSAWQASSSDELHQVAGYTFQHSSMANRRTKISAVKQSFGSRCCASQTRLPSHECHSRNGMVGKYQE